MLNFETIGHTARVCGIAVERFLQGQLRKVRAYIVRAYRLPYMPETDESHSLRNRSICMHEKITIKKKDAHMTLA